jgi:hypothetical protein
MLHYQALHVKYCVDWKRKKKLPPAMTHFDGGHGRIKVKKVSFHARISSVRTGLQVTLQ